MHQTKFFTWMKHMSTMKSHLATSGMNFRSVSLINSCMPWGWQTSKSSGFVPNSMTLLSVMLASDKTHLSTYSGDKNMHPIYISLGNIHKDVWNKPSRKGWMLLAKLPTSKFAALKAWLDATEMEKRAMPGVLQKRLFHSCMSIVLAPLQVLEVSSVVDANGKSSKFWWYWWHG